MKNIPFTIMHWRWQSGAYVSACNSREWSNCPFFILKFSILLLFFYIKIKNHVYISYFVPSLILKKENIVVSILSPFNYSFLNHVVSFSPHPHPLPLSTPHTIIIKFLAPPIVAIITKKKRGT